MSYRFQVNQHYYTPTSQSRTSKQIGQIGPRLNFRSSPIQSLGVRERQPGRRDATRFSGPNREDDPFRDSTAHPTAGPHCGPRTSKVPEFTESF